MKKIYKHPTSKLIKLEPEPLLAGSLPINEGYGGDGTETEPDPADQYGGNQW